MSVSREDLEARGNLVGGMLVLNVDPVVGVANDEDPIAIGGGKLRPDRVEGWWPNVAPNEDGELSPHGTWVLTTSGVRILIAQSVGEFQAQLEVLQAFMRSEAARRQLAVR